MLVDWESFYNTGGVEHQSFPTFTGPLSSWFSDRMDFADEYPVLNSGRIRQAPVVLKFARTGPITRSVEDISNDDYDDYLVTLTAPMRLTGRVDWARLGSPKVQLQITEYRRVTEYTRPVTS